MVSVRLSRGFTAPVCVQWQQPSSCFLSGYLTGPDKAAGPASVSSSSLLNKLRPHFLVVKLSIHDAESKTLLEKFQIEKWESHGRTCLFFFALIQMIIIITKTFLS